MVGDDDKLVERLGEQGLDVLGAGWAAARVARLAFDKAGARWWLAIADLVIALVIRRHWRPPPRGRGHQRSGRSRHAGPSRWSGSASGEWRYRHSLDRARARNSAGPCARRRSPWYRCR